MIGQQKAIEGKPPRCRPRQSQKTVVKNGKTPPSKKMATEAADIDRTMSDSPVQVDVARALQVMHVA
jgi:hypothetical protein